MLSNEGSSVGAMGRLLGIIVAVGLTVTLTGIEVGGAFGAFEGMEVEVVGFVVPFVGIEVDGAFDAFEGFFVGNTLGFNFVLGIFEGALEESSILGDPEYAGLREVGCWLRGDGFDVKDAGFTEGALLADLQTVGMVVMNGADVLLL